MRRLTASAALLLAALLGAGWAFGAFGWIAAEAASFQREFQNAMAGALRALRGGDPAALAALLALSFGYGVAHAAGPGHGKFLIAGYGVGRRVGFLRLAGVALASSLAQALTAIAFVAVAYAAFGWARERVTGLADNWLEPLSHALIGCLGLWLFGRGVARAGRLAKGGGAEGASDPVRAAHGTGQGEGHGHDGHAHEGHGHDGHGHGEGHGHAHHVHDAHCGHAHLPTGEEIAAAGSFRELAALVASVAVRPCTGALFVLILTFAMGLPLAGIASAIAMGVGTAAVTVAVAAASVTLREGMLASLSRSRALAVAMPAAEIGAGLLVTAVAFAMLWPRL